jgi:hypothetical protein
MADYQILCVTTERQDPHEHIVNVGTGPAAGGAADRMWTVKVVRKAIKAGTDSFYTVGPESGERADVRRYKCGCGVKTIRSADDAVEDNNLDSLASCP